MFVCRLVSGVRSSCDASATKRRCVSIDSSSAASIVLNAVPSRPSSSGPPASATRSLGSPVRAIRSAAPVRRLTGTRAARDDERTAGGAGGDSARDDEQQNEP